MPNLKPFRQYAEVDVINLFAVTGSATLPLSKGTFVRIVGSGFVNTNSNVQMDGGNGATYSNTVSPRYSIKPRVAVCTSGLTPIGMTLYDVRETDENSESLLYHPHKRDEMQCVLSGQAVPIVTKGIFLYSGINSTPTGGATAYLNDSATDGSLSTVGTVAVGKFLGAKDTYGCALVKIDL
jgi:hypothetical protein